MGEIPLLNSEQETVLTALTRTAHLPLDYYFTGGTALSCVYLKHRESADLDFFTQKPVNQNLIISLVTSLFSPKRIHIDTQFVDPVLMCFLTFPNGRKLKVDFAQYPYPQLEPSGKKIGVIAVDSMIDIATNKLLSVTQRSEPKDFIDLYFLLQKYTFWDLRTGVEQKFRIELEPSYVGSRYLAVEDFTYLPKMIKPLTLKRLQAFFREQAVMLGKTVVE